MTAKHLIISLGEKTFLALPKRGMLVEGHCLIMPLESVVSSRECDEDVYIEFTRFKKQLQAMFFATNKSEVRTRLLTQILSRGWSQGCPAWSVLAVVGRCCSSSTWRRATCSGSVTQ